MTTTIEIRIAPKSGPALLTTQSFHLDELPFEERALALESLGADLVRNAVSKFLAGGNA